MNAEGYARYQIFGPALSADDAVAHDHGPICLVAFLCRLVAERPRPREEPGLGPRGWLYDGRLSRCRFTLRQAREGSESESLQDQSAISIMACHLRHPLEREHCDRNRTR